MVNPFAFKGDTTFKGHHAYVAWGAPVSYRYSPYNSTHLSRAAYPYTAGWRFAPGYRGVYTLYRNETWPLYGNENRPIAPISGPATPQPRTAPVKQENNTSPGSKFYEISTDYLGKLLPGNLASPPVAVEEKQCYYCCLWGHVRKNCYQEHPELHPANRAWVDEQLTYLGQSLPESLSVKAEEANVMARETVVANEPGDHPFELNMIMEATVLFDRQGMGVVCGDCHPVGSDIRVKYSDRHWLVDSRAMSHYIMNADKFWSCEWLSRPIKVGTGKRPICAVAKGEVELTIRIGNVVISNVLLVPDLDVASDLLSVPALLKKGFTVTFDEKIKIIKEGKLWDEAKWASLGGFCYLEEYDTIDDYAFAAQCTDTQIVETWHGRLDHVTGRTIRTLPSHVAGIKIGDDVPLREGNLDFVACLKGTQHQTISRYPFMAASRHLERLSWDIAGPMRVPYRT